METRDITHKLYLVLLIFIISVQFLAGLWRINYPFVDGRVLYNWGPPFWLNQAKSINEVGITSTYFGLKGYPNHPQLIGPVISIWTQIAGYSEVSIRILTLLLTCIATLILTLAIRNFIGNKKSLAFSLIFASLPLIYIYGRKLDQEALVLVFLALYLLGISYLKNNSQNKGYILVFIGALGMTLSDWWGVVFTGILSLSSFLIFDWKSNKKTVIKFILLSVLACILALFTFLIQSYLQAGSPGFSNFFKTYYNLWRYRAGISQSGLWSWGEWIGRQFTFLSRNYSITLFVISLIGLVTYIKNKINKPELKNLSIIGLSVFLGELIYIILLPQASGIHIYFQYFFSIPVAIGLVLLLNFTEEKINIKKSWGLGLTLILICTISFSIYEFHKLLFKDQGGDPSDIELIKTIRGIPNDKTVVVTEINQNNLAWYQNPNMIYYSGRELKGYLLEEGTPISDYQIVPKSQSEAYVSAINQGGYGKNVSATIVRCSTDICLVSLNK